MAREKGWFAKQFEKDGFALAQLPFDGDTRPCTQFGSGEVDRKRQAEAAKQGASAVRMGIPARPFYPVKDGKLTPAAERLIAAAAIRTVERVANG